MHLKLLEFFVFLIKVFFFPPNTRGSLKRCVGKRLLWTPRSQAEIENGRTVHTELFIAPSPGSTQHTLHPPFTGWYYTLNNNRLQNLENCITSYHTLGVLTCPFPQHSCFHLSAAAITGNN